VTLDLPDNMVNDLIKILGEVPAKMSYVLLQTISQQAAEHNKRVRHMLLKTPGQGVPPADTQE
jgi:hypothetical protein